MTPNVIGALSAQSIALLDLPVLFALLLSWTIILYILVPEPPKYLPSSSFSLD